ncbi:MAG: hypothetical protein J2O44_07615 [Porphyrobacter sp.]|nr:hypothetical protein [Porphyrobacter sp.]
MITAPRAIVLLTSAALALSATPGLAQVDNTIVLNIMRECAKIDDPTARLACYDNNIRAAGATPRSVPGQMVRPNGGGAIVSPNAPSGFGADDVRSQSPERFHQYGDNTAGGPREVSGTVAAAREREPGVYLVTLGDGAQWLFAESGGSRYPAPRKGDTVRIEHGALGSYLMVINHQQAVKVTRIK